MNNKYYFIIKHSQKKMRIQQAKLKYFLLQRKVTSVDKIIKIYDINIYLL